MELREKVIHYWSRRSGDFSRVRENELEDQISERWMQELLAYIPMDKKIRILDIGTGTGYFAILLAKEGHEVVGIDLTPMMIQKAKELSAKNGVDAQYVVMDAQALEFSDESFDMVISRNLTWTLPDPEKAYREWFRVLKKGGILLNFDACYGKSVTLKTADQEEQVVSAKMEVQEKQNVSAKAKVHEEKIPYGHQGITPDLEQENAEITLSMRINHEDRPSWDEMYLKEIGFGTVLTDETLGARVLREHDLETAPMFKIYARKD